jgi:hypothetical protein
VVDVHRGVEECCLSAFRIEIAAILQENTSLESLSIRKSQGIKIKAEGMIVLVTGYSPPMQYDAQDAQAMSQCRKASADGERGQTNGLAPQE